MIPPQLISVRVRDGSGRSRFRLWLPILPVLILALPLVVLGLIVAFVALAACRINPVRGLARAVSLLHATRGIEIGLRTGDCTVRISVR